MKKSAVSGFTLLEILIVLAILGVLIGAIGWFSIASLRRANLNEAAVAVTAELNRARSLAQRSSTDQPVIWTATTLRGKPLAAGATISTPAVIGLNYTAPYGELVLPDGSVGGYRLELVDASGQFHTAVDLVGVTGKAMRRQVFHVAEPLN